MDIVGVGPDNAWIKTYYKEEARKVLLVENAPEGRLINLSFMYIQHRLLQHVLIKILVPLSGNHVCRTMIFCCSEQGLKETTELELYSGQVQWLNVTICKIGC